MVEETNRGEGGNRKGQGGCGKMVERRGEEERKLLVERRCEPGRDKRRRPGGGGLKMQVVVQLCAGCRYVPSGCVEDQWERFRWGGDCECRGEYRACREQRLCEAAGGASDSQW